MKRFHNILFATLAKGSDDDALRQALTLARNNGVGLEVLVVCPDLPEALDEYRGQYQESLVAQVSESIQSTRDALELSADDAPVEITVDAGAAPAIRIIRRVLRGNVDLLVKEVEPVDSGRGFRAVDMELLRKCPCALWLARPDSASTGEAHVAVAVDPDYRDDAEHDLSIRLLQVARSLADSFQGELTVVSCWDYEYEDHLRNNPWVRIEETKLMQAVHEAGNRGRNRLESIIREAGLGAGVRVAHLKGQPDRRIPEFVGQNDVDVLVMGTLGRTGIPGFVIGNTAENVVQKIGCSLLAMKPNGFVSPVKSY